MRGQSNLLVPPSPGPPPLSVRHGRIEASIGSGLDGYHRVRAADGHGSWQFSRGEEESTESFEVTPEQWQAFWRLLDRIRIWTWHAGYVTRGVCDGTHWSLDLAHGGKALRSSGDNGYPGSHDARASREFELFCAAVSELAGGRSFS